MARYIELDALVAEIERRVNAYQKNFDKADNKIARLSTDGRIQGLKSFLSYLDTLEIKEVDLEKELDFVKDAYYYFTSDERSSMKKVAKHFFELGLKAQKGE